MNKITRLTLALGSTLLCFNTYAGIPNNDDPTTFLGPTLKGRYTAPMSDNTAVSVLGEAGVRNLRAGATLGWRVDTNQRLKFSAEWLRQEITYAFFSGNSDQWVNQWAIGAGYQYDISGYSYEPAFDFSAYYSHAPSKTLSTRTGSYTNSLGNFLAYANQRRIAGSNAAGLAPGLSFSPWMGSRAGVEINYDYVVYDNKYVSDRDAKGFGGTVRLDQAITENLVLNLSAAVRQPFNNYTARIGWGNVPYFGGAWTLGIDGAYTAGKETLPNTWNIGLSVDYLLEPCPTPIPVNLKGDYKGEATPAPVRDPFWAWTAKPAVYMPQVLAIVDERVTTGCGDGVPPLNVATIADLLIGFEVVQIPTAQAFSGNNLIFSVVSDATPPNTVVINPLTGIVTVTGVVTDTFDVTVTATNACGSASTTFTVVVGTA